MFRSNPGATPRIGLVSALAVILVSAGGVVGSAATATGSAEGPMANVVLPVTHGGTIDLRGNRVPQGFPNAASTGVPAGQLLLPSGDLVIRRDEQVIQNLDVEGCVTVRANDVMIRNVRIRCAKTDGVWPIRLYPGYDNLTVVDTEIDGQGVAGVAICCENYTLRRADVHNVIDGPRLGSNTKVIDSFIHNLVDGGGKHPDALQTIGGSNIRVVHNTLLAWNPERRTLQNAAIQTGRLHRPLRDMVVTGNYMDGGHFTVRGGSGMRDRARIRGYVFSHNVLGRNCGFGPLAEVDKPVLWESTNRWVDARPPLRHAPQQNRYRCTRRSVSTGS